MALLLLLANVLVLLDLLVGTAVQVLHGLGVDVRCDVLRQVTLLLDGTFLRHLLHVLGKVSSEDVVLVVYSIQKPCIQGRASVDLRRKKRN